MNDDEARYFRCPKCELRIGEIENDGALLMYPGVRTPKADFVCRCGESVYWRSHEAAMDSLISRVLRMRSGTAAPASIRV